MKTIATLLLSAATLTTAACRAHPTESGSARAADRATQPVMETFPFQHQDARAAANYARAEFGQPPMEGVVRVECDPRTNAWIVRAIEPDMARMRAIVARYDQPGEAPWSKRH